MEDVGHHDDTSSLRALLARMQNVAGESSDIEHDEQARASLLQLSRELTTSLEQPDEVVSLVAFSVQPLEVLQFVVRAG